MAFPFIITLDGELTEPAFGVISAQNLRAEVLPRPEWPANPEFDGLESAEVWLYEVPIFGYQELTDEASIWEGEPSILLGAKLHLLEHGDVVTALLEPGYFYDILCVGWRPDGVGFLVGGCRFATSEIEVPTELTFEEARLFALASLGIRMEDGDRLQAKIRPFGMWDFDGRVWTVEFEFGSDPPAPPPPRTMVDRLLRRRPPEPALPKRYSVEVDHRGGVTASGGHDIAEVREYTMRMLENSVFA